MQLEGIPLKSDPNFLGACSTTTVHPPPSSSPPSECLVSASRPEASPIPAAGGPCLPSPCPCPPSAHRAASPPEQHQDTQISFPPAQHRHICPNHWVNNHPGLFHPVNTQTCMFVRSIWSTNVCHFHLVNTQTCLSFPSGQRTFVRSTWSTTVSFLSGHQTFVLSTWSTHMFILFIRSTNMLFLNLGPQTSILSIY